MIPSLEGWPTKAKETPSHHEVRLTPLDTNPVFLYLGNILKFSKIKKNSKKDKSIKKGSHGIEFYNFTGRIKSLINFDTLQKPSVEYKEVSRFTVFQCDMLKKKKKNSPKTKISQLNNK